MKKQPMVTTREMERPVGNAVAQQHEDTGADGTTKAQTNNVPKA